MDEETFMGKDVFAPVDAELKVDRETGDEYIYDTKTNKPVLLLRHGRIYRYVGVVGEGDINLADVDPFAQAPMYREEQVITPRDLKRIHEGFIETYHALPWWNIVAMWRYLVGLNVVHTMLGWLSKGKPNVYDASQSVDGTYDPNH